MMKIINLLIYAALLIPPTAYGASVIASTTGSGAVVAAGNARAIYDLSGNAILQNTGYVGVGYFTSLPTFSSTSAAIIESSFNRLGSIGVFGVNIGGGNISNGLFNHNASDSIVSGTNDDFIGQNIFVVIGNGSTIGNSTGLLVLQSSITFAADAPSFAANVDLQTGTGLSVLYGSNSYNGSTSAIITIGANTYYGASNSYQMAALIPEPSSFFLASLSLFGFVLRRKR